MLVFRVEIHAVGIMELKYRRLYANVKTDIALSSETKTKENFPRTGEVNVCVCVEKCENFVTDMKISFSVLYFFARTTTRVVPPFYYDVEHFFFLFGLFIFSNPLFCEFYVYLFARLIQVNSLINKMKAKAITVGICSFWVARAITLRSKYLDYQGNSPFKHPHTHTHPYIFNINMYLGLNLNNWKFNRFR